MESGITLSVLKKTKVYRLFIYEHLAAPLAQNMPRPWENQNAIESSALFSPAKVQRDFLRIIQQIGTPAQRPKPRGFSPGRQKGEQQQARKKQKVIFKQKKKTTAEKKIA